MKKREFNFLDDVTDVKDIAEVEVVYNTIDKLKAPEKGTTVIIDFPILTKSGSIPTRPVEYYQWSMINEDGKTRYYKCLVPESKETEDALIDFGAELRRRDVTVVVEISGRFKGKGNLRKFLPQDATPKVLVMDSDKLVQLQNIQQNYNLEETDISVTSNNPTFQAMTFTATMNKGGGIYLDQLPDWDDEDYEQLYNDLEEMFKDAKKAVASDMKDATIKKILGSGTAVDNDAMDEDDDEEEIEKESKALNNRLSYHRSVEEYKENFEEDDDEEEDSVDEDISEEGDEEEEETYQRPRRRR